MKASSVTRWAQFLAFLGTVGILTVILGGDLRCPFPRLEAAADGIPVPESLALVASGRGFEDCASSDGRASSCAAVHRTYSAGSDAYSQVLGALVGRGYSRVSTMSATSEQGALPTPAGGEYGVMLAVSDDGRTVTLSLIDPS